VLPRCIATLSRMLLQHNWSKPASRTRLLGRMVRSWDRFGVETGRGGPSLTLLPGRCGRQLLPLAHLIMEVECPLVQSEVSVVVVSVTVVRVP
jgi:hypothetical protein